MCDELKAHGYSIFEISESMPWHLDLLTETLKIRLSKKSSNPT
ncbi:hypothetical protein [Salmonella phage vB-SalM-SJ3]|uniref:Uncharacterized protein n=11 Tax=Caudoviricetes TaxID=2731619 RepID=G9IID9_9CAUD|nr:hypothetical protein F371_gp136 [Escherichia phage PhaxI]YP_009030342.1 hypothetical protein FF15_gp020 [Salmonella phage vB-SalM-SJ3]YP_009140269.1 hypothetical protein DET7_92 [Salmonella phage Det7]YP_009876572.1 hypothetical protein HYP09_gp104 [Salmonella phage BSP101]YP_009880207.1 hypothetical protein HYP60_gp068 [Escherichia phage EP75]YP_009948825.1 hypothetical protein HYQ25_gp024 [Salmonella phage Se-B]YP_009966543.1 hypothetical protein HYQ26_gp030 [Salmonella phage Se-G]YP_00